MLFTEPKRIISGVLAQDEISCVKFSVRQLHRCQIGNKRLGGCSSGFC